MTLITATTRLSRELQREYDREQVAAGLSTWPTAHILPFQAWLAELWDTSVYSGEVGGTLRLLRPSEERAIWEDIIRADGENLLLEVPATAAAALKAWGLLCEWGLPLDAPEWNDSTDSEVFYRWAWEFRRRSRENGWLSNAELPVFIADRIGEGALPVPEKIEIVGFLELTPVQKRLFDTLTARGTEVKERVVSLAPGDAVRIGRVDTDREIRAAAEWARRILETDTEADSPEFRIGIVVANLEQCRGRVERIFSEAFHPTSHLRPDRDTHRLFNISLGLPLSEYPIIAAAFLVLESQPQGIPMETLGQFLRSPFLRGTESEWTSRALLDVALRSLREPEVSLEDVLALAGRADAPYHCPELQSQLIAWREFWQEIQPHQMPSDWAASLSGLLEAMGWPGAGPLDSVQFQTIKKWRDLLSDFAGLDSVLGSIGLEAAVGRLYRLASTVQFQPESDPAPVQILGVFETSGLVFDRLWIMGMHDGAWPPPPSPDAFLPFRLQRKFDLPRSSPDRELEFAHTLTARLVASAPTVVVSYPQREDDFALRVSPLFQTLPEVEAEELGLRGSDRYIHALRESRRGEVVEDHNGPGLADASAGGGTSLFKLQAMCPFKAFAELRLGATELDEAKNGLSALDRGLLMHRVLQRIWDVLGSHAGLLSTGDEQLADIVRMTVSAELHGLGKRRRALRRERFREIEQERLERVIAEWLQLERERRPFTVIQQEARRRVTVGGIDLSIRADRMDRLENGDSVVLDYKTGECSASDWLGARPNDPQLPIYAVTAEAPVAGVFYGRLKTGKVAFRGVTDSEGLVPGVKPSRDAVSIGEKIDDWHDVLDQLGEDFREGRAAVDPKDRRKTCRYCALPTLCRINEAQRSEAERSSDAAGRDTDA